MSETATNNEGESLKSSEDKRNERLKKLRNLNLRRNEARKLNHEEVIEEAKREKLPSNWETKRKFAEYEIEKERLRAEYKARGEDYDKVKLLDVGADEAEAWKRKKKKNNADGGFSSYEAATYRQYQRLTKQMKPDLELYEQKRGSTSVEKFYPAVDTLGVIGEHKDSEERIQLMVDDLGKQIAKRKQFSRRRRHDDDADIDYINERNAKFNKKLERFYGKYTTETKQNLERGTAV